MYAKLCFFISITLSVFGNLLNGQFSEKESESLEILHSKMLIIEHQIESLCGLPCNSILKEHTLLENVSSFFISSYHMGRLILTMGFILGIYHAIASKIDENDSIELFGQTTSIASLGAEKSSEISRALLEMLNKSDIPQRLSQTPHKLGGMLIELLKNTNSATILSTNAKKVAQEVISMCEKNTDVPNQLGNAILSVFGANRQYWALSGKNVLMLMSIGIIGFFGADFINQFSPLCPQACDNIHEYKKLFINLFPDIGREIAVIEEEIAVADF